MTGYIIGLILGVLIFVMQNLKPTSLLFRISFLILTIAFLWGISYLHAGYWNILIIPIGVLVLCFIAAFSFPYRGKSAISEYMAVNGRDYYLELKDDDLIGNLEPPAFKQRYDRIIVGILNEICDSKEELQKFGNLLYSENFYPISRHTKKDVMEHINTVIADVAKTSKNCVAFLKKANNRIEFLFNAYVSVMSIHEEATRRIEEIRNITDDDLIKEDVMP